MALIDNLLGYWNLDGNSTDSKGTSNGTDTAIIYSVGNGKIAQGAGFNGFSSSIYATLLSFPLGANPRSVSLWAKCESLTGNARIFSFGNNAINQLFCLFRLGSNIVFTQYGSSSANLISPTINVWYHYVMTYDGTTWTLYVNGVSVGTWTIAINTQGSALVFGSSGISSEYFTGDIDEVGIWSRVLTTTEISQIYNNGNGLQYPFSTEILNPEILLNFL